METEVTNFLLFYLTIAIALLALAIFAYVGTRPSSHSNQALKRK
jgi:hypothetical protein